MTPRRVRRRREPTPETPEGQRPMGGVVEHHADGDWIRRAIPGSAAGKLYRCPGCDQEIRPGTPHTVAWLAHAPSDRRHWHTACWSARQHRTVKVHRAKNAPRYG